MKFYTPYNLPDDWNNQSALHCDDLSLTTQADKDDADINVIVRRFGLTGELPYGVEVPQYADYSDIPNDFHAAMQFVEASNAAFMEMPADVRTRFNNDAGNFLDFVNDPVNFDEAVSLGLAIAKPAVSTSQASETQETKAKPASGEQLST